jgi:hypothetical protein
MWSPFGGVPTSRWGRDVVNDLVVDLRGMKIETLEDFWDAVSHPCGLPVWFGRNVEAWRDAIQVRGISDLIDRHDAVVVHVDRAGIFSGRNREARAWRAAFAGRLSRLVVHHPTPPPSVVPTGGGAEQLPG